MQYDFDAAKVTGETDDKSRRQYLDALRKAIMQPKVTARELTEKIRAAAPEYHFKEGSSSDRARREALRDEAQAAIENMALRKGLQPCLDGEVVFKQGDRDAGARLGGYIHLFMSSNKDPKTGNLSPKDPLTVMTSEKPSASSQRETALQALDQQDHRQPENVPQAGGQPDKLPEIKDYEEELHRVASLDPTSDAFKKGRDRLVRDVFDHMEKHLDTYLDQIGKMSHEELIKNADPVMTVLGLCDPKQSVMPFSALGQEQKNRLYSQMQPGLSLNANVQAKIRMLSDPISPLMDVDQVLQLSSSKLSQLMRVGDGLYEKRDVKVGGLAIYGNAFSEPQNARNNLYVQLKHTLLDKAGLPQELATPKFLYADANGKPIDEEKARTDLEENRRPVYMMLRDHPEAQPELVFLDHNNQYRYGDDAVTAYQTKPDNRPQEPEKPGALSYLWDNICKVFGSRGSAVQQYEDDKAAYERSFSKYAANMTADENLRDGPKMNKHSVSYLNSPEKCADIKNRMYAETLHTTPEKHRDQLEKDKAEAAERNRKAAEKEEMERRSKDRDKEIRGMIKSLDPSRGSPMLLAYVALNNAKEAVQKGQSLTPEKRLAQLLTVHTLEETFVSELKTSHAQGKMTEKLDKLLTLGENTERFSDKIAQDVEKLAGNTQVVRLAKTPLDYGKLCPNLPNTESMSAIRDLLTQVKSKSVENHDPSLLTKNAFLQGINERVSKTGSNEKNLDV